MVPTWPIMLPLTGFDKANNWAPILNPEANYGATGKGWWVMPELMVQHGINCAFSVACGMSKELIGLSTVPPTAPLDTISVIIVTMTEKEGCHDRTKSHDQG
jgi:hypothetical protein